LKIHRVILKYMIDPKLPAIFSMLDPKRYPTITRLLAGTEFEHKPGSDSRGGNYDVTYKIKTDLSDLVPTQPTEDHLSEFFDKISLGLEKEVESGIWKAVRHQIPWSTSVWITNFDVQEPFLNDISEEFNSVADEVDPGKAKEKYSKIIEDLKKALKNSVITVDAIIQYEMPVDVRLEAEKDIENYLKRAIDGLK